jgi:magnesium transporter
MNFTNMPELRWKWGYYAVLAGMAAVGVFMWAVFKKLKWL